MKRQRHLMTPLVMLMLVSSACTTIAVESPADTTAADESTSTAAENFTSTTVAVVPSAGETLETAIAALLEAGSYAFASTVELDKGQLTTVEITGWVDGADRELTVTSGEQSVSTMVKDGLATVTRDGETIEVPLAEAGEAPSLEILNEISRSSFSGPTTITGSLSPSSLRSTGFDINGSAEAIVRLSEAGELEDYNLTATNSSWSIDVTFSSVGQDFSS